MKRINTVEVLLADNRVGELVASRQGTYFAYDPQWVAEGFNLSNIAKNLVLLVRGWIARGARASLVRPRLLLNILFDHAQGGASDTSRKVAWTPQRVLPVGGLHQFRV